MCHRFSANREFLPTFEYLPLTCPIGNKIPDATTYEFLLGMSNYSLVGNIYTMHVRGVFQMHGRSWNGISDGTVPARNNGCGLSF
jgi:hypothetical protein